MSSTVFEFRNESRLLEAYMQLPGLAKDGAFVDRTLDDGSRIHSIVGDALISASYSQEATGDSSSHASIPIAAVVNKLNEYRAHKIGLTGTVQVGQHKFKIHPVWMAANSLPARRQLLRARDDTSEVAACQLDLPEHLSSAAVEHIVNFLYTGELIVPYADVSSVVAVAKYLEVNDLLQAGVDYLKANLNVDTWLNTIKDLEEKQLFDESAVIAKATAELLQEWLDETNWMQIYRDATSYGIKTVVHTIMQFLSANFWKIFEQPEMLDLPFDHMKEVINSDQLRSPNEERVCDFVLNWVAAKPTDRQDHLFDMLTSGVRLQSLSIGYLKTKLIYCKSIYADRELKRHCKCAIQSIEHPDRRHMIDCQFPLKRKQYRLFAIGGQSQPQTIEQLQLTNPEAAWAHYSSSLAQPRRYFQTVSVGNDIYMPGGSTNGRDYLSDVLVLNVESATFRNAAPMITALHAAGTTVMNSDNILTSGGFNGGYLNWLQLYSLDKNAWTQLPSMSQARHWHALEVFLESTQVIAIAGHNGSSVLSSTEIFDLASQKWVNGPSISTARDQFASSRVGNQIFVFGGGVMEVLDIRSAAWSTSAVAQTPAAVVNCDDGRLLAFSGSTATQWFDIRKNAWQPGPVLNAPRSLGGACLVKA